MIKIWARIEVDNKLKQDLIYQTAESYSRSDFFLHLTEICYQLNIPTPILIESHFLNYENFNNMKFLPRDFVESINFDKFILESVLDN